MSSQESSSTHSTVVPSEVGWQFVPQYYTFVNKHPGRLHCFYTKTSTFIHGTEGEEVTPCHGQQEIHSKITSIGFEDCKVFIHSVDAQSSANGGIIIQVIGEMSNHGDPWRKFVQTFFLAEQPNGYFVLNDIFRFLKEESVEGDDASETDVVEPSSTSAPVEEEEGEEVAPVPPSPAPAPAAQTVIPPAPVPIESPATPAEPTVSLPSAEPAAQPNGIHPTEPEPEPIPVVVEEPPTPAPAVPEVAVAAPPSPSPIPAAPSPAPSTPAPAASPSPAPQQQPLPPQQTRPPPPATPAAPVAAPAPAAPKTWANLAATNSKKWGAAVATESRGTSEVPITASAPNSGAGTPTSTVPQTRGLQHLNANSVTTPQVFVKGVAETISNTLLTQTLTTRFGPIKDLEVVRSKACAFLEFLNIEHAKRAIFASLPTSQGGEGGIRIDVGGGDLVRINVETRKERGDRPPTRPRGGPPMNGDRGGFRGRGGLGRGGRGGPAK